LWPRRFPCGAVCLGSTIRFRLTPSGVAAVDGPGSEQRRRQLDESLEHEHGSSWIAAGTSSKAFMKIRINGDLRGTPSVRLIGSSGEMLGVMTLAEALRRALQEGLDLVEVNPRGDPPVCRILDFSKYKYPSR
jgi:hypothetical protein